MSKFLDWSARWLVALFIFGAALAIGIGYVLVWIDMPWVGFGITVGLAFIWALHRVIEHDLNPPWQ